jgi:hypothetical protein
MRVRFHAKTPRAKMFTYRGTEKTHRGAESEIRLPTTIAETVAVCIIPVRIEQPATTDLLSRG